MIVNGLTEVVEIADRAASSAKTLKLLKELVEIQTGKPYEEIEAEQQAESDFVISCPYADTSIWDSIYELEHGAPRQRDEKIVCEGLWYSKTYVCSECAKKGKHEPKTEEQIRGILANVRFSHRTYGD